MVNLRFSLGAIVVFILATSTYAVVHEDIGNADEFFDNFLQQLFQQPNITKQLAMVDIPDIKHGNFETWGGRVFGLKSLRRDGHCTYSISNEDKNLQKQNTAFLKVQMTSNEITFMMSYQVKILFVTVRGVMEGKIGDLGVRASFYLNEKENVRMDQFDITRFDGFEITRVSTNLSQSSWIMKMVANSLANKNKQQIVEALKNGMAGYLKTILKDIDLSEL